MHANRCKMKGTWSVAEAPETNKTTPRSISEPVEEWVLASCWISNMLISSDFHKTLESKQAPPQKDNHNSNYSDVKEFDGSYICFPYFSIFPICLHIFPWCVLYFPIFPLKNPCHFPALVLQAGPSPRCNCAVCPSLRPQPGRSGRWRRLTCETRRGGIREGWMGSVSSKGM